MRDDILNAWADDLDRIEAMLGDLINPDDDPASPADVHGVYLDPRLTTTGAIVGHWDMQAWGRPIECGFAGCAFGWAIHRRVFEPFGIRAQLHLRGAGRHVFMEQVGSAERPFTSTHLANTIGIRDATMDRIVMSEAYDAGPHVVRPGMVARRIRELALLGETEFCRVHGIA